MSYYFDSYYLCGDKKFFNIYQAFKEQKTSGHFPTFVIDNDLIKSIGDFKRPKKCSRHALQDMMIKRLKQIRSKYGKLKLAYGGGTDSYTIAKLCVENDIYIDETVTLMCSLYGDLRTNLEPYAGLKSLKQYEGKQIGKITQIHPTVKDLDFINDPDWFCDPNYVAGPNLSLRYYSLPQIINRSMAKETDAIMLTGFEKPAIRINEGKIFWYVNDHGVGDQLGIGDTIPFFLDKENPELIVALAYTYLDAYTRHNKLKEGDYLTFESIDKSAKFEILEQCGYFKTPYNFINMHFMGKQHFDFHRKNIRFMAECKKHGHQDFIDKMFASHSRIKDLFGNLPHALESQNGLVKSVGRLSQQIPMNF